MRRQFLNPAPDSFQGHAQSLYAVLEPARPRLLLPLRLLQGGVIARAVLPIKFVDRKDVGMVEAAPIQFPQAEHAAGASVAIGKGVDRFKRTMQDGGAQNRRDL